MVEQASDILKKYYLGPFCKDNPLPPLQFGYFIDRMWVNVTLSEKENQTTDYRTMLTTALETEDLFVIEGVPGIGKTMLMRKIVHDWASGHFPKFKLAIYGEFRQMTENENEIIDLLWAAVKHRFLENSALIINATNELIQQRQNDVLVVLDGFDEVNPKACGQLQDILSLGSGPLPYFSFKLILSARPNRIISNQDIRFGYAKIEGFDKMEQKIAYIRKYFENDNASAAALTTKLQDMSLSSYNRRVRNLSQYPLYLAFVCAVYKELQNERILELYIRTIIWQLKLFVRKQPANAGILIDECGFTPEGVEEKIEEKIQRQWKNCHFLHKIGKLAFTKLIIRENYHTGENIEISDQDLTDYFIPKIATDSGFLTNVTIYRKFGDEKRTYNFLHRTFQEYFAALYCVSVAGSTTAWWQSISAEISDFGDRHFPSEFEYFLFRFIVEDEDGSALEQIRPLLQKYTTLEIDFSRTDIETGEQLRRILAELVNLTNLTITGVLREGNISFPGMDLLQNVKFYDVSFQQTNQTILPLPLNEMPALIHIEYRGCPYSMEDWRSTIMSIFKSTHPLYALDIHCTDWSHKSWQFLADFFGELVNCLSIVETLYIIKRKEDQWPPAANKPNDISIDDIFNKLFQRAYKNLKQRKGNLKKVDLNLDFIEYCGINMHRFPWAREATCEDAPEQTKIFTFEIEKMHKDGQIISVDKVEL